MSKTRGKHTTVIEGLDKITKKLQKEPEIQIAYGIITTGLPTGKHLMKSKQLSGGVELSYRATRTKQVAYLYGKGTEITKKIEQIAKKEKIPHTIAKTVE